MMGWNGTDAHVTHALALSAAQIPRRERWDLKRLVFFTCLVRLVGWGAVGIGRALAWYEYEHVRVSARHM